MAVSVAIQGIAGCFSHAAASALQPGAAIIECHSFADVFASLASGLADRAVVPIENSIVGPIAPVLDLLAAASARVLNEHTLPIEQCLILPSHVARSNVRSIISHPVALAQCSRFLIQHSAWQAAPFFDTAASVREAMIRSDTAAIAGAMAAATYGATVVEHGIGDRTDNATRFLLIASSR